MDGTATCTVKVCETDKCADLLPTNADNCPNINGYSFGLQGYPVPEPEPIVVVEVVLELP